MKVVFNFFLLCFLFACSSASSQSTSEEFDRRAQKFFKGNVHRFEFAPTSNAEKCILENTIAEQLTALNDWRMILFYDTFNLKTYSDPYLQLSFSFIENRESGKFYFLWIPFLRDHIYKINSNYKSENDSIFVLQEPMEAIKVPAELIDTFFDNSGFLVKDEASFYRNVQFAENLMSEVLPSIFVNEISVGAFESTIEKLLHTKELAITNYRFIKERLVDPMFTVEYHRLQTFYMENIGFVVLTYTVDRQSQLKVNIYFIPNKTRYWLSRGVSTNYRECFR